jgi:hypothetical protein
MLAALSLSDVAAASGWAIQSVPPPVVPKGGQFVAASCARAVCVAVGSYVNPAGKRMTLAERWNGRKWSMQRTPNPSHARASVLNGVTCSPGNECIAVGSAIGVGGRRHALAERLTGRGWRIENVSRPSGARAESLAGVACSSSSNCWAVGYFATRSGDRTLTMLRDSHGWHVATSGSSDGVLAGVSCLPNGCFAVGASGPSGHRAALAKFEFGNAWAPLPAPLRPAGAAETSFKSISCPLACFAVGEARGRTGTRALAEMLMTTGVWTIQAAEIPRRGRDATLAAVWCGSHCVAVGSVVSRGRRRALIVRSDGGRWRLATTPNPPGVDASTLDGVSCTSACLAERAGAPRFDRWRLQATPGELGATPTTLESVSCAAPGACTAVGHYANAAGVTVAFAERWNGVNWTVQAVPRPPGAVHGSVLNAVSCPSSTVCMAVGYFADKLGTHALAESWNGSSWVVRGTPDRLGSAADVLTGVSCPGAITCIAVGSAQGHTLAESWNGIAWSLQATPDPNGGRSNVLTSVSCSAIVACTAVGSTASLPLAERWDGLNWTVQPISNPPGAVFSQLDGVSCAAPTVCAAVGITEAMAGGGTSVLSETWNGLAWASRSAPSPNRRFSELKAVSCPSATACTAVGVFTNPAGAQATLAERFDGNAWTVRATPNPAGSTTTNLRAVSCSSATACVAVGIATVALRSPLAEAFSG